MARHLFDVPNVFSVRPIRVAKPATQAKLRLCPRASSKARHSIRIRCHRSHTCRFLSRLSGEYREPEYCRLFATLFGVAVRAEPSPVVLVAAFGAEFSRDRHLLFSARRLSRIGA